MKIFIIEDDPDHATIIQDNLGPRHDYTVITSASEAVHLLFHNGTAPNERPDLILLDLRFDFDSMNGLDILGRIKNSRDKDLLRIPVIVLTSSKTNNDLAEAYEQHVNSYLVKPTEPEDWSKMMADVERYWEEWNVS